MAVIAFFLCHLAATNSDIRRVSARAVHGFARSGRAKVVRQRQEDAMGFMDKAKKLAEQAQEKLDEAQKNFNKGQSGESQPGGGVRYDEHGRPIQEGPPAADAPPPSGEPAESPAEPTPKPPPEGGADASPDPFKPIQ
jgi:hypothetical protein